VKEKKRGIEDKNYKFFHETSNSPKVRCEKRREKKETV
jgi:hypothetical protein